MNRRTVVYDVEAIMAPLAVVGQQNNGVISDIWLIESCSSRFDNGRWQFEKENESCLLVSLWYHYENKSTPQDVM